MKKTKIMSAVLAAVLAAASLTGCGTKKENENVVLKYIMPGPGTQEDSQEVWAAFNDKLHEKLPNVSVEFEVIPLSEYKQKVMLMMSAREQIDIINNYGLEFATEVGNGSFVALNDLLDKYGKETREALPEWLWDYQTIDGNIYGVTSYQMMGQTRCFCTLKELADKYLDTEALTKAFDNNVNFSQEIYDILTDYCAAVKGAGINFKTVSILNLMGYDSITGSYGIRYNDDKCEVVDMYINDSAETRYKLANDWYKAGYIRSDALSANDDDNYKGKIDGMLFWDEVYTPYQADILSEKYGAEIITIPYDVDPFIGYKALAGGTSISSSSEYPEEAMQVINLLQSDAELYNLLVFGIEGENYTKLDDTHIQTTYSGSATANDSYGLYKWIVGNTSLAYNIQSEPEGYNEWAFDEVNSSPNRSKLMGFQADTTEIADMISQVNSIKSQYLQPLNVGAAGDWQATYEEYKQKSEQAGESKIIAELQKQIDEFLAAKK